jgi:hypothetical protein
VAGGHGDDGGAWKAAIGTSWFIAVPASVEHQVERGRADRLPIGSRPLLLTERKSVEDASAAGRFNKVIIIRLYDHVVTTDVSVV